MTTIKKNEIIAKYMGLVEYAPTFNGEPIALGWVDPNFNADLNTRFNMGRMLHNKELMYHRNFDWLMPVVDKINQEGIMLYGAIDWQFDITSVGILITNGKHNGFKHGEIIRLTKEHQPFITAIYNSVVEYLIYRQDDMIKRPYHYGIFKE